jgi:hypothetical protein
MGALHLELCSKALQSKFTPDENACPTESKKKGGAWWLSRNVGMFFYSPCGLLGGTATLAERTVPPAEVSKALKASSSRLQ